MTTDKKTEYLQSILSHRHAVHHKSHTVYGVESNVGLRGELSTNQSSE